MPGALDIYSLQQALWRFAAARDWEQFHSPKNLAMALSVESAVIICVRSPTPVTQPRTFTATEFRTQ